MTQRRSTWGFFGTVDVSHESVEVVPGHRMPTWVDARYIDSSGVYPQVVVRAELRGTQGNLRVVVSNLMFGGEGEEVQAAHLRAFGPLMHDLAEQIYDAQVLTRLGPDATPVAPRSAFRRLLREASRGPAEKQIQRQDNALRRWETEFEPAGMTQREAAAALRMKYSTFRSYLTHARNRRGK